MATDVITSTALMKMTDDIPYSTRSYVLDIPHCFYDMELHKHTKERDFHKIYYDCHLAAFISQIKSVR